MGAIRPLKLPGAPDQELMEQGAGRCSRFGASSLEQAGLLNKEPTGPLWGPWVMWPLEQAGAPDEEAMEPHGPSKGSRSKDNGPLELGL